MKLAEAISELDSIFTKMDALTRQAESQFNSGNIPSNSIGATTAVFDTLKELAVKFTTLAVNIETTKAVVAVEVLGRELSLTSITANIESRYLLIEHYEQIRDGVSDTTGFDFTFADKEIADLNEEIRMLELKQKEAEWTNDLLEVAK